MDVVVSMLTPRPYAGGQEVVCPSGMCGAAFYSAGRGGAKVKIHGAGRGGAKVKIRGAGRKSAQINQFKNFTKV